MRHTKPVKEKKESEEKRKSNLWRASRFVVVVLLPSSSTSPRILYTFMVIACEMRNAREKKEERRM